MINKKIVLSLLLYGICLDNCGAKLKNLNQNSDNLNIPFLNNNIFMINNLTDNILENKKTVNNLLNNIWGYKNLINILLKEGDDIWEKFKTKFSPQNVNIDDENLKSNYQNIWQEISSNYDSEIKWTHENLDNITKEENLSKYLTQNIKLVVIRLLTRIEIFKKKILNAESKMAEIQSSLARKHAWERIFAFAEKYNKIREEIGDAYVNKSNKDSEKIAKVIDNYFPGNYNNIWDLCYEMKNDGFKRILINGSPDRYETQIIDCFINATNSQKIIVSCDELLKFVDGREYAKNLLHKYKGEKKPLILVIDKFETIAKKSSCMNTSKVGLIVGFFDEVVAIKNDPKNKINLGLVLAISNINKEQLDPASINRMSDHLIFGSDYTSAVFSISQACKRATNESEKDFIKNILNTCEELKNKGNAPNTRDILKAFQAEIFQTNLKINQGKNEKDKDFVQLWDTPVTSENISKNILKYLGELLINQDKLTSTALP